MSVARTVYPPIDLNETKTDLVLTPPEQSTFREVRPSGTENSTTDLTFDLKPPLGSVIHKKMYIRLEGVQLTFQVSPKNSNDTSLSVLNEGYDNFASYPVNTSFQTTQLEINGRAVSNQVYDILGPVKYSKDLNSCIQNSSSNMMEDHLYNYGANNGTGLYNPLLIGSPDKPHFNNFTIVTNPNLSTTETVTATVTCDITEPLFHTLLSQGKDGDEELGFPFVNQLYTYITWRADYRQRLWRHASPSGMTGAWSLTGFSYNNASLLVNYMTPSPLLIRQPSYNFNYRTFDYFPDSQTSIGVGSQQIPSSNFILKGMPRMIFVYVRQRATNTTPERYLAIDNINITLDNRSGVLAESEPQSLYQISKRNGITMDWKTWNQDLINPFQSDSRGIGSILALTPNDLACIGGMQPGVRAKMNFQYNLRVNNKTGGAITGAELVTIICYDGQISMDGSMITSQEVGLYNVDQVLDTSLPFVRYPSTDQEFIGGNLFSDAFRNIKKFGKSAIKEAKELAPYAQTAYQVGKMAAPYVGEAAAALAPVGLGAKKGRGRGRGKKLTLKDLM